MRIPLMTAAMFAAILPVSAHAQDADGAPLAKAAEMLEDPEMQEQVALTAAALVGVLMELPVGTLANAASEAAGETGPAIDPDARVRDLVGADGVDAPQLVAERLPQMMTAVAGMAGAFEAMMPQLREFAARLPQHLPAQMPDRAPAGD